MWPPNSFGLVDRCALFDIRNQDRRELSGLAHCVPPAVGRLAQMPVPVCLFRRKDRSCAHSFRTEHQAGRSPSGRFDAFAKPSANDRYLRNAAKEPALRFARSVPICPALSHRSKNSLRRTKHKQPRLIFFGSPVARAPDDLRRGPRSGLFWRSPRASIGSPIAEPEAGSRIGLGSVEDQERRASRRNGAEAPAQQEGSGLVPLDPKSRRRGTYRPRGRARQATGFSGSTVAGPSRVSVMLRRREIGFPRSGASSTSRRLRIMHAEPVRDRLPSRGDSSICVA